MKTITRVVLGVVVGVSATVLSQAQPSVKPAIDGVLALFQEKPVVVLCDYHGLAQEEDFYSAVVRDPRFAEKVGNVIVEFGGEAYQNVIDRYVAGDDVPADELRRVWTETPGWVPGPTRLGYINFFAAVRAANSRLAPEHRIKVWLGEPKVDWSKINSYEELRPYTSKRDDNYVRIIRDEILATKKKALLIIGTGHIFGAAYLANKLEKVSPGVLATVAPFTGYVEPECNAKFVARAKDWPMPATVVPTASASLKAFLDLPGCNFLRPETIARVKAIPVDKLPPGITSAEEMLRKDISMVSGDAADALLYLGPPDTFTESLYDPAIYLDPAYFKEQDRRRRCCTPPPFQGKLDLDRLLQMNGAVPRKLEIGN